MNLISTKFKILVTVIILILLPLETFAQTVARKCSSSGFSILTINGILTDKNGAISNRDNLKRILPGIRSGEPITFDYLLNPSHFGGVADLLGSAIQKAFGSEIVADYDLIEILNDASEKVKTQKLLLVAHSQGNFYANSFYDVVAGQAGGVPKQSIGVFGVATPASRVAGDGEWLTSDTDNVIAGFVDSVSIFHPILPANIHIAEVAGSMNPLTGHSFSDVYLKYPDSSKKIVEKINYSLAKLSGNTTQREDEPCLFPPQSTLSHKLDGAVFFIADTIIETTAGAFTESYNTYADIVIFGYHTSIAVGNKVIATTIVIGNTLTNTVVAIGSFARDAVTQLLSGDPILADSNSASIVGAFQNSPLAPQQPQPPQATPENLALTSGPALTTAPALQPTVTPDSSDQPQSSQEQQSTVGTGARASSYSMSFGGGFAPEVLAATTEVGSPTEESVGGGSFPPASSTPADVVPPVITIIGEAHATSTEGFEYIDKGATAFDERDGEIVVTASSTVDITTPGVYVVLYAAVDKSNNIATSTRVVDIIPAPSIDRTPPIVTILGPNPEMVVVGSTYIDAGASAIDDVDGARDVIATSTVDTNTIGGYTVTYLTQDSSGNVATSTRVVNVILKSGQQINFKENNRISYAGSFAICDIDHKVANVYGSVGLYGNFVSSSGWGTRYQAGVNTGMTPGVHYRFIFGSLSTIMQECQRGMYSSNVSNIFHYTNSSGDSVVYDPRSASFMTSFYFPEITNDTQRVIDLETHLITVVVPRGTNVAALAPTIKVSAGAQVEPNTGVVQDFTNPVSYKVTATDGSYHFYTVKVVLEGQKLNFDAANKIYYAGYFGLCDVDNRTMNITGQVGMWNQFVSSSGWGTPYQAGVNTDMLVNKNYRFIFASSDKAYFDCTNNMFTSNYSENFYYTTPSGSSVVYSTYVKPPPSSAKSITSFDVNVATSTVVGVIDEVAHRVDLIVPFETNVTVLSPVVTTSALATSSPASGVAQDFTMPVEYIVTAEDGTTQVYIVTVTLESTPIPPVVASSERAIVALDILVASSTISGVVDEMAHTISLTVPFGTDVLALSPRIVVSALATSSPASLEAQDFTNPVMYTVTAEDSSTQVYVVSVVVEAPPATLLPAISSYTFNGIAGNITADFATTTPTIELLLVANKDVDWVSITIENQTDATKYKRFYSGAGCADDTAVCVKTWDGVLSSGEVAPNGEYRIKAHIKDTDGNDFNDYLLPYTITTNREEI